MEFVRMSAFQKIDIGSTHNRIYAAQILQNVFSIAIDGTSVKIVSDRQEIIKTLFLARSTLILVQNYRNSVDETLIIVGSGK